MKINASETKKFAILSNDKNEIHLDKDFASNFFFKEPIVHGVNVVIKSLNKYFKKKKKQTIKQISINFKNFILVGENFEIIIKNNKIIVQNDINIKLEIFLKFYKSKLKGKNKKFKNHNNFGLINHLISISHLIGTVKPGNGALIHKINLKHGKNFIINNKPKIKKLLKNAYEIEYQSKFFKSKIVSSKVNPFKDSRKSIKLSKKSLRKIKNKKILIFGINSDLSKRINCKLIKKNCKIYSHSFRIEVNGKIKSGDIKNLKLRLINLKPDYIFYFSAPKIYTGNIKNKKLQKYFENIFVNYFSKILYFLKKYNIKSKIFYPSTFVVNEKNNDNSFKISKLSLYINSKIKAEKICKTNENKKIVYLKRLPQLRTRVNYNILGYYEGENLDVIDKYIDDFFQQ